MSANLQNRQYRSSRPHQGAGVVTAAAKALVVVVVSAVAFLALQGQDPRVTLLATLVATIIAIPIVFWDELVPDHEGLPLEVVRSLWTIFSDRDVLRGLGALAMGAGAAFAAHYGLSQILGVYGEGQDVRHVVTVVAAAAFLIIGATAWFVFEPKRRR